MTGAPRVCFVADSDGWGGAEIWLRHHLHRSGRHGWRASLVCTDGLARRLGPAVPDGRLRGVPLARHSAPGDRPGLAVAAAIAAERPDLVVVNLVDPASNAAALAAAQSLAPTVGVLHLAGDVRTGAEAATLRELYAGLELVVGTAREAAEQVARRLAVPRRGVRVVGNGVEIPASPHGPAGGRPPRVGVHGRLTRQKGVDLLVAATRELVASGRAVEVVVGGSGRDETGLHASARDLPVRFVGWVEDHRAFLSGLDVFCLPSRHDALPLALLEAMAEGLPCVVSDVGDVAERVGDVVELVPPEDAPAVAAALARLLDDPLRRRRLGRDARARAVERLDAETMVGDTFTLLRECLTGGLRDGDPGGGASGPDGPGVSATAVASRW